METYTILKLAAKEFDALRRVFQTSRLVVLVDTAVAKIWLNCESYSKELRTTITNIHDYFDVLTDYYSRNFGWCIDVVVMHRRAAYTLMRPCNGDATKPQLIEASNSIGKSYFKIIG